MIESIAIGSFDGVHIAHQKLIELADAVVIIERFSATLTPGWKRTLYIKKPCYFYLLEKIKHYTPREFIDALKRDFPNLKKIIVGYDFRFGKEKSGSIESLKEYFNGEVVVVNEVKIVNVSVHSRVIRDYLRENSIDKANSMLGRRYRVDGRHIKGLGLGSKELVATINLSVEDYILPHGVYATYVTIDDIQYKAVAFIGNRESIDNSFSIEVHILDMFAIQGDIYSSIWVEFVGFIRSIKKFDSLQSLKSAIKIDIQRAKEELEAGNELLKRVY